MLGDGLGHLGQLAVVQGIVAAHRALQLRELSNHAGHQVGFGQPCSAIGGSRVGADPCRNGTGQCADPLGALRLCAEFGVVDHGFELNRAIGQPLLFVLLEEEPGIGQSWPDHPLVAVDDERRVVDLHVRDDQESRLQSAVRIEERKILLVGAHGQDQALLRHLQERRFEGAHVDRWPLDQCGHFIKQGGDRRLIAKRCTQFAGLIAKCLLDARATIGKRGDHPPALLQHRLVLHRIGEFDIGFALEAVPLRDPSGLQSERRRCKHRRAMQHHQAMGRAHEADICLPVGQLILHDLGDRQFCDRVLDQRRNCISKRRTGHGRAQVEAFLLAVGGPGQCLGRGALLVSPFAQGQCRLTFRVQSDRNRGALDLDCACVGSLANRIHPHSQTPGRREDIDLRIRRAQALLFQTLGDRGGKGFAQPQEGLGRELFGEQFDEQRVVCHSGDLRHQATFRSGDPSIGNPSRSREAK